MRQQVGDENVAEETQDPGAPQQTRQEWPDSPHGVGAASPVIGPQAETCHESRENNGRCDDRGSQDQGEQPIPTHLIDQKGETRQEDGEIDAQRLTAILDDPTPALLRFLLRQPAYARLGVILSPEFEQINL